MQSTCGNCGASARLPESARGPAVRCVQCGFVRTLPRETGPHVIDQALRVLPADRYRVEGLLQEEGGGRVYLARHLVLDSPCVVKVLGPGDAGYSATAAARLAWEARIGFRISHPGVVRVLDVYQQEDTWYVVMEYADGADLATVLTCVGPLVWMQAAELGRRTAEALHAIHAARLIHRDLKPGNLLLQPDGSLKIADLGLACTFEEGLAGGGQTAGFVGTPPYAPPEQRRGGQPMDPRADIYSLGATLYHAVTGRPPQRNKSPLAYLVQEQYEPIVWDTNITPTIPDWFREAIETCLAQQPEGRYPDAATLRDALARPPAAPPTRPRRPAAAPLTDSPRIVVLPFANAGGQPDDDWIGDALADHISRRIVELRDVHLIDRHELGTLMERFHGCPAVRATDAQVCAACGLVGASTVVRGRFRLDGATAEVEAHALNVLNGAVEPLLRQSGVLSQILGFEIDLGEAVIRALGFHDMPRVAGRTFAKGTTNAKSQKLYAQAQHAFARGEYKQAIALAQEALEADPGFVDLIGFIGVCHARQGQYDEAIQHHNRLKQIADEADDPYRLAEAVSNLGVMHYFKGDYGSAYDLLCLANRLEQKLNLLPILSKNYNNLGFVLTKLERLEEADDAFQQAIEIMTSLGTKVSLISSYNGRGEVAFQRGRHAEAAAQYETALALATQMEDQVNVGICHLNLGRCAARMDRLDEAERRFQTALERLLPTTFWHGQALVYEQMTELHLRRDRLDEALECIEQRTTLAQRFKNRRIESACWEQKARAYQKMGQPDTAVDCMRKSFEIAQRPVPAGNLYEYVEAVARRLPGEREG